MQPHCTDLEWISMANQTYQCEGAVDASNGTVAMAADSRTKGLEASRLPQICEDLKLIDDQNVKVLLNVVAFNIVS